MLIHLIINLALLFCFIVFGVTATRNLENYVKAEDKTKAARLLLLSPILAFYNFYIIGKATYTFIKDLLGVKK